MCSLRQENRSLEVRNAVLEAHNELLRWRKKQLIRELEYEYSARPTDISNFDFIAGAASVIMVLGILAFLSRFL